MVFDSFLQAIASSALKRIAQHWNTARGSRLMPGWSAIQPSTIAAQLRLIWVYRYDRSTDTFTGRLAGDLIERIFGKSFRGTPMKELYPAADYPRLFARAKRVICEPALFLGQGMVFKHVDHVGEGERIIMPLGEDGVTGDGVFGATVYQSSSGASSAGMAETEQWFSLASAAGGQSG